MYIYPSELRQGYYSGEKVLQNGEHALSFPCVFMMRGKTRQGVEVRWREETRVNLCKMDENLMPDHVVRLYAHAASEGAAAAKTRFFAIDEHFYAPLLEHGEGSDYREAGYKTEYQMFADLLSWKSYATRKNDLRHPLTSILTRSLHVPETLGLAEAFDDVTFTGGFGGDEYAWTVFPDFKTAEHYVGPISTRTAPDVVKEKLAEAVWNAFVLIGNRVLAVSNEPYISLRIGDESGAEKVRLVVSSKRRYSFSYPELAFPLEQHHEAMLYAMQACRHAHTYIDDKTKMFLVTPGVSDMADPRRSNAVFLLSNLASHFPYHSADRDWIDQLARDVGACEMERLDDLIYDMIEAEVFQDIAKSFFKTRRPKPEVRAFVSATTGLLSIPDPRYQRQVTHDEDADTSFKPGR
ncbi:hypothetical protein [Rhizobium leguminosarum]|uniref:hypothetical protein n=1 Tax=Rhizobium leguminosarum TaxID=384 RepID=UPI002E1514C5|nr:hypothetical protein U8Q02_37495 [Rhizobium leguminosarum]